MPKQSIGKFHTTMVNKAYLVYNKEKEPKDNDKGEGDLINKEYVMLVNILNKYKLLAYHV